MLSKPACQQYRPKPIKLLLYYSLVATNAMKHLHLTNMQKYEKIRMGAKTFSLNCMSQQKKDVASTLKEDSI